MSGSFLRAGLKETCYVLYSTLQIERDESLIYTVNQKKTWQFIFDYNFG